MLVLILLGFGIFKFYNMYLRENPTLSKLSLMRDIASKEATKPQDFGFDFAFGLGSDLDP